MKEVVTTTKNCASTGRNNYQNLKFKSMKNQNNFNQQRTRCEVWSRVMGYHRPVSCYNLGKKSEHYSRQHFSETATVNSNFCKKERGNWRGFASAEASRLCNRTFWNSRGK